MTDPPQHIRPEPARDAGPVAAPHPAATVVLVRSGPDGLEVLLTHRPGTMSFAPGLHVFPGGRLDPADADPGLLSRARGPVADPEFRAVHRIAAIRETWEEVGVLLATPRTAVLPPVDEWIAGAGSTRSLFVELCRGRDLELATDSLVEIAHWITPRAYPRRFDTRFFVAELPPTAMLTLRADEVADHRWATPRAALAAMARGELELWPPTSTTLQRLERASSFEYIRAELGLAAKTPIRLERFGAGLAVLTGTAAFGPTGRAVNTVLVGRKEVVVVDPGDQAEPFLDAIETAIEADGGRIVAVALTHVDPGHASGSHELAARTGAPIFVGPGGAASLSWPVREIAGGGRLWAGDVALDVFATPGHRPDHLAFLLSDGTLLTGDALTDRPTLVLGPDGDPVAARETDRLFAGLLAEGRVRRVVPGHGPVATLERLLVARN